MRDIYSVAAGEGRNVNVDEDNGLSYTGRIEVLPFGEFTNEGDYFGSDLAREQTPKLSVGGGFSYNNEATRSRGELGTFLNEKRNITTAFADLMFKYKGFSVMSEYMEKSAPNPVLSDTSDFFVTGSGFVVQGGYLFKNNLEVAARYTTIDPSTQIYRLGLSEKETEYTLGVSKYIVGHNLKVQTDLSYSTLSPNTGPLSDPGLVYRFQVELAI